MTNKEIASKFKLLGAIMELHGENPFKIGSYTNAYMTLRKWDQPLTDMSIDEISKIKGVGKAISEKIIELIETGELKTFNRYAETTPPGIVELLEIRGFGPKKIKTVWKELGVESAGELLYACHENRLVKLKGFGEKTQTSLIEKLEYHIANKGKFHFARLEQNAEDLLIELRKDYSTEKFQCIGEIGRNLNIVESIDILTTLEKVNLLEAKYTDPNSGRVEYNGFPVTFSYSDKAEFGSNAIAMTASKDFLDEIGNLPQQENENDVWASLKLQPIPAFYRESVIAIEQSKSNNLPQFIDDKDILGVIHNHSTYSDGIHTLKEMADYTRELGYPYLVISDHSKAAFYANGLDENRVVEQWQEIDDLNNDYTDFKIFKGIECDILSDGSMDYDDDFLKEFEVVIASIHSVLNMDKKKATERIIRAVENPHVHILGHPTGRLLLSRLGYEIDHMAVIDACAANNVALELNANPHRLDLDWSWIPYALEKKVMISINPDAHSKSGIHNIHYGVVSARKGGLTPNMCLNSLTTQEFENWFNQK